MALWIYANYYLKFKTNWHYFNSTADSLTHLFIPQSVPEPTNKTKLATGDIKSNYSSLSLSLSFVSIFFSGYCIVLGMSRLLVVTAVVFLAILVVDSKVLAKGTEGDYHLDRVGYGPGSLKSYECPKQCSRRCRRTQYKKPCLFFCNKCCKKCLCVPPGFYGNKSVCPCYGNWKTKNGGPKCP